MRVTLLLVFFVFLSCSNNDSNSEQKQCYENWLEYQGNIGSAIVKDISSGENCSFTGFFQINDYSNQQINFGIRPQSSYAGYCFPYQGHFYGEAGCSSSYLNSSNYDYDGLGNFLTDISASIENNKIHVTGNIYSIYSNGNKTLTGELTFVTD